MFLLTSSIHEAKAPSTCWQSAAQILEFWKIGCAENLLSRRLWPGGGDRFPVAVDSHMTTLLLCPHSDIEGRVVAVPNRDGSTVVDIFKERLLLTKLSIVLTDRNMR